MSTVAVLAGTESIEAEEISFPNNEALVNESIVDLQEEVRQEVWLTVKEVAKKMNVSTKTVDRWRNKGLAWEEKYLPGNNHQRVLIARSALNNFAAEHPDWVQRGERFSQLSNDERNDIISRAKELAREGDSMSMVCNKIFEEMGRTRETIRYTIRFFDGENPNNAVFPEYHSPLATEQEQEIYSALKNGSFVSELSKRYDCPQTIIIRIRDELQAQKILSGTIEFMDSSEFTEPDAEEEILGPPPETKKKQREIKPPPGLPPYLANLYQVQLLTREQEQYYFRKMNYLKHKASSLRSRIDHESPKPEDLNAIDQLLNKSLEIKNLLIKSNLRLVVSIAKRYIDPNTNFIELVSDGNISLMRAIEKFDYTKGNKLSTYATWAIMKNFARSIPKEHALLDRFRTYHEVPIQLKQDTRTTEAQEESDNQAQKESIRKLLTHLYERDAEIITLHFGLEPGTEPHTLQEMADRFGVTKERIRQRESRGLKKLKKVIQEQQPDIPGMDVPEADTLPQLSAVASEIASSSNPQSSQGLNGSHSRNAAEVKRVRDMIDRALQQGRE